MDDLKTATKNVSLSDFDGKKTTVGQLTVRYFSSIERTLRALKFFGIFFGLAVFSVFIPVLHFILVPGFCIAAVGSATLLFLQTNQIDDAQGPCPYCEKATRLSRAKMNGEFRDSCEHCLQLIVCKF